MRAPIDYTPAAQEKMHELLESHRSELEQLVVRRKKFPGEQFVEITASDLDQAARSVQYQSITGVDARGLIFKLYGVMGTLLALYGLFRNEINDLFTSKRVNAFYFIGGAVIAILSFLMDRYFTGKRRVQEEMLRAERSKHDA